MPPDPAQLMSAMSEHSSEFSLIRNVADREFHANVAKPGTLGIGDDAAFVPIDGRGVLIATDTLLEGVHFDDTASAEQIGHKAIAVNLSDIAAMAAVPTAATVAISVPRNGETRSRVDIDRVLCRLQQTAHRYGVAVVGGDTTAWAGPLAITVSVIGELGPAGLIARSGGRAGDRVYVTGPLGGSIHGRHLKFEPRVREALALVDSYHVTAMIDLSDGLASDARHLASASGCMLTIDADCVPIHNDVSRRTKCPPADALHHALTDGEDFELLVAIRGEGAPDGLFPIGTLAEGSGVMLKKGEHSQRLDLTGYSHDA